MNYQFCLRVSPLLVVFAFTQQIALSAPPFNWKTSEPRVRTLQGSRGMVVSDDSKASTWGAEILKRGGNAVDAAVGTAFALAVTRPHFASLGGGGFFLFCPAPEAKGRPGSCVSVDYRERAPKASTADMFQKPGLDPRKVSTVGGLASGVPGVVAGLALVHKKWGKLKLAELLSHPIELAEKGVPMTGVMEEAATNQWNDLNAEAKRILGCKDTRGELQPCRAGTSIVQADLAQVLKRISAEGAAGFYRGKTAADLVAGLRAAGGVMTLEDLAEYSPKEREPIVADLSGKLKGVQLVTMPPPSSGGVLMVQMMHYIELAQARGEWSQLPGSAESYHLLARMMRLAFADRTRFLADPDFVQIPVATLTSFAHAETKWAGFDRNVALDAPVQKESTHTTHFSVVDRVGNAVGITTTVNGDFGSGVVPPGTGVVMNNEMDDFKVSDSANLFGLVTGEANRIEAGKRPVSSMSPTIVRDQEGRNRIVLGAEGGPKIITSVFQSLVNRLVFGMALPDAVEFPRVHHQWLPEELVVEAPVVSPDVKAKLKQKGYQLKNAYFLGTVHALEVTEQGRVISACDVRGEGAAAIE